jgi:hypothetical protein
VRDTLAFAQSKAGDLRAAAETAAIAVRLEPDTAKWRIRLAHYLLEGGNALEAAKAVRAIDDRRLDTGSLPPAVREQLDGVRREVRGGKMG